MSRSIVDEKEETLDPRIQEELEKLNEFTNTINALESQLTKGTALSAALISKLGSNTIDKARPYYAALELAQNAQNDCQTAATNYQRAAGIHEERFLSKSGEWKFDEAWQAMLNNATIKVVEAETLKTQSQAEHLAKAAIFTQAEARVSALEKSLGKFITKSKPYFQRKERLDESLEAQKARIQELQGKVAAAKGSYARSLRNLEAISESIHAKRKKEACKRREPGVGAESSSNVEETQRP
ncbi:Uncharacterized protein FKW44_010348 [Caligus rogercresseyi]|uniref:SH3 domain-binding protein 5-like n=1 Tax=Caligus rogercresseyi TaxID=217165 RepID=A0A7T8HGM5_CALRO|nr:Uncharacterized protein FKW44_010348 [Caligus rogercresseyi]